PLSVGDPTDALCERRLLERNPTDRTAPSTSTAAAAVMPVGILRNNHVRLGSATSSADFQTSEVAPSQRPKRASEEASSGDGSLRRFSSFMSWPPAKDGRGAASARRAGGT